MSHSIWIDKKDLVGWSTARSTARICQTKCILYVRGAIAGGGTITILNPQNFSCLVVEWRTWVLHLASFSLQGTVRPISLVCCDHCLGFRYVGLLFATFSNDAIGIPSAPANFHDEIMMLCTVKRWPSPASMSSPLPGTCRGANKGEKLIGIHNAYWKTSLSPNNLLLKIGHCYWFISIIKGTPFLRCAKSWAAKCHSRPSFPVRLSLFVALHPHV